MGNDVSQPCKFCDCEQCRYNRDKAISADGQASEEKQALKFVFPFMTGYIGHALATKKRFICGHRKDDHKKT